MNFVFVSPNFPVRYFKWVESLAARSIRVLGIGDTPYNELNDRLKRALTEYYYLPDLGDYPRMKEACAYFERKYGHLDYLESDNEWWLTQDAKLREEFRIDTGLYPADMHRIKAKSAMKEAFEAAGVKTMRYTLLDGPKDLDKALEFASEVGYPLFVKPDVGVGAADSFKIKNEADLRGFLDKPLSETYIMEEYIEGSIVSFDGICDSRSDVVFCTSDHFPVAVAKIVNGEAGDYGYYDNPFELPFRDLDAKAFRLAGERVVKSFGIKKRFFHIEFFVLTQDKPGFASKGEFVALECNMRPAGGNTPDLIDYAMSVSCYEIYADVIAYDENRQKMDLPKYYSFAAARRDGLNYLHSDMDIKERYAGRLMMSGRYPKAVSQAMGDLFYYGRFETFEEGDEFDAYVRAKRE